MKIVIKTSKEIKCIVENIIYNENFKEVTVFFFNWDQKTNLTYCPTNDRYLKLKFSKRAFIYG